MGPNVVLCSLSDEIIKQCGQLIRDPSSRDRRGLRGPHASPAGEQLSLPFDVEEAGLSEDEVLLYRSFRRALKARVMTRPDRLPIQIAHAHLYSDGPGKDDPATRAWSVTVALFYKAGGLPWRLAYLQPHVCFMGLSFHRLVTNRRNLVYGSVAQAFSSEIEGFVLRGERVNWERGEDPHLSAEQAFRLGQSVMSEYRERAGREPVRVTLHKTTRFSTEEQAGFKEAFGSVPALELLTLQVADLRVLTLDEYPVERGTLCSVNNRNFLYTTGFYRDWGTYPGPHVPAPLELRSDLASLDLRRVSEETLALSKMNWNSASIGDRDPITIGMASRVGPIMAEVPDDEQPELSYRYYM